MAILFLWSFISAQGTGDSILGKWYTEKCRALFDFYRCGREYKARMIPLERPDMVDSKNPVDSLRSRRLNGMTAVYGLTYDPAKKRWENGKVYDPEDGRTYSCYCRLDPDGSTLVFRGYIGVGFLGGSQKWTREKGTGSH
jgi:uncharacterized protein (DUF2147 family)